MFSLLPLLIIGTSSILQEAGAKDVVKTTTIYVPKVCPRKSKMDDILTTEYVGYFLDGKKFDATYDRKQAMRYTMGAVEVIKGAEQGSMDMCVGEKRNTVLPASLAYGNEDYAQIPAGSILVFDTVLTKIEDGEDVAGKMADMGLKQNLDGSFPLFK